MANIRDLTDDEDFAEAVELLGNVPRAFQDRPDQFNRWSDEQYVKPYRISKETTMLLLELINDSIAPKITR